MQVLGTFIKDGLVLRRLRHALLALLTLITLCLTGEPWLFDYVSGDEMRTVLLTFDVFI